MDPCDHHFRNVGWYTSDEINKIILQSLGYTVRFFDCLPGTTARMYENRVSYADRHKVAMTIGVEDTQNNRVRVVSQEYDPRKIVCTRCGNVVTAPMENFLRDLKESVKEKISQRKDRIRAERLFEKNAPTKYEI